MQSVVMNPQSDMPDELLYGRVGYLYSQLYIIKNKLPCVVSDTDLKNVRFDLLFLQFYVWYCVK